ncbi:hypothetical protein Pmar_PMAR028571 [Perkinsus marinus ATCC 50983]|uniref:Peptidase A1 domain-containing protein n=1 Tax=Perkinsus marinus (strain ATCC 50983 / TXsc) TaxID=423536 RepID=C5LFI5_PERM5|nr:hypothetical protein Pmar_PMAR028571 [Perkinsus marinus ATCC 50983]EER04508.1 hypothetical protein Pmar_PMAR028571 [Perkinsus marinus ATCC 50983]|eukprot:XP_002772692.1 hypothetical protein Pmar_PMAR028571 [Perkinsus marinus ATCC 50983]
MIPTALTLLGIIYFSIASQEQKVYIKPISVAQPGLGSQWNQLLVAFYPNGQEVNLAVDTGSTRTFLVWRAQYERVKPGGCHDLIYHCFGCSPKPCEPGPLSTYKFYDGREVTMFSHLVHIDNVGNVPFGLVTSPEKTPWASLGLSLHGVFSPRYPLFIDVLLIAGIVTKKEYTIYLNTTGFGRLIFGGDYPMRQDGPLRYVSTWLSGLGPPAIDMMGFLVGDDCVDEVPMDSAAFLATGLGYIQIADSLKQPVLKLLENAGVKHVAIREESGVFKIDCEDIEYLPSITFFLKV